MPSRAAYIALAVARSDTGCSTILIPWVEEPVMVTPEVVGHMDRRDCRAFGPQLTAFFTSAPILASSAAVSSVRRRRSAYGALVEVRRVVEAERRVPRRAAVFSSWACSFIAARSSAVNPPNVLSLAVVLLAGFFVSVIADFLPLR